MTDFESRTQDGIPAPEQVGPYRIERELGSGGMGTVYLGRHVETGRMAAVKVLPASLARETGFVARFNREVAAMQQLQSPHIVELYDSGEDQGTYYYAMEYVPGETLTERLQREKRLPWREAIDIAVQVCKALKAAHNCGIVHRDLKPSNLLIHESGTVKLTDFGIAQVFATSKLTVTGGILGTAEYMSPEQAQGKRATRQSDIYSLGAVLYVMLTGRPPFTGKTTLEIIQKHKFSQFDSPRRIVPEIPLWLDEIICKCLSKKTEDRYPDAYVVMLRLQEVPKKIDLQQNSGAGRFEGEDPTGETLADTRSPERAQPAGLGGTFVRDLFRAQLESEQASTPWERLFNNVWILLGLLLLVLAGGYGLAQWTRKTPAELFAQGEKLMQQPEGSAWDTARKQYFDPLMELDAETWGPQVEPYLTKIQLYELKKQLLGRNLLREPAPQSEPEAILRQSLELRKLGRIAEAREKLAALETLIAGNDELQPLAAMAAHLREELTQHESPDRLQFVAVALQRADDQLSQGQTDQARAIWRSVVDLYHADPAARPYVAQAREKLAAAGPGPDVPFPAGQSGSPSPPIAPERAP